MIRRESLLDFFRDFSELDGPFLVYDSGYRSWTYSYRQTAAAARAFAARLREEDIHAGDKVLLWGENRPEWIAALWGCLLEGVVAVPIDYRASQTLVERVHAIVGARLLLAGYEVSPAAGLPPVWPLASLEWSHAPAPAHQASKEDIAEIIFTSGATSEPKGVIITHGNVLANIVPVEREVRKYAGWGRPFFPIRFLNLLPLSHMFGQSMATFIPPMLGGVTVFMHGHNPGEIARQIRSRRISVLVSVPKILEVLREHVVRVCPEASEPKGGGHWLARWWRYRRVHRLFGWKFWAFVVGAAPLDPELEEFWSRLGFVLIQGYGLTETAPIVTLNHPFHAKRGTVGKPIAGVEVRLAQDGEILVRGGNVTRGYFNAADETARAFEDGWFHTGDIGAIDENGHILIRGRKKEMIVTPEGLNVFPEDIERVLNALPGVRDSAAVGEDRVHAVLVLDPGADAGAIVREANTRLEDHQRIHGFSIWPDAQLTRTEGTGKLKRREIFDWVSGARPAVPASSVETIEGIISRFAGDRMVTADTTLDELGLGSLERVELMMELEKRLETTIDEGAFTHARTVGDLRLKAPAAAPAALIEFPAWTRSWWGRLIRNTSLPIWILPVARLFAWIRVRGREHLRDLKGPVIFASNHQSHLDTPVIFAALGRRRYRLSVAMSKEFFRGHFFPREEGRLKWITNSLNYCLACLFFNAFPLPQREAGARETIRYAGEVVSDGFSILIFPEGKRSKEGEINRFQAGVGMMAARLGVPVVPIRIDGALGVLHQSWKMARPGWVTVTFGEPLHLAGEDYAALAKQVEEAVRDL